MRTTHSFSALACGIMLAASTATGEVTVTHVDDTGGATIQVGETFTVDVIAGYDGIPAGLTGFFTSASWDTSQLEFLSATAAPFAIFFGATGSLSKFTDPAVFATDPPGTLRTVQFGAPPGQSGSAGADTLITTLTFQVVGVGDGTAEVTAFSFADEGIFAMATPVDPSDITLTSAVVNVPEPSSGLLSLSALGVTGLVALRRTRVGSSGSTDLH